MKKIKKRKATLKNLCKKGYRLGFIILLIVAIFFALTIGLSSITENNFLTGRLVPVEVIIVLLIVAILVLIVGIGFILYISELVRKDEWKELLSLVIGIVIMFFMLMVADHFLDLVQATIWEKAGWAFMINATMNTRDYLFREEKSGYHE